MKRISFLLVGFLLHLSCSAYESLITVVLMVKNEEQVICKTIEPMLKGGIDTFFIFDTGSTDNTVEVVEQYFKDNNVEKYSIAQEPFVDFSTSRNRGLDLAKEAFPDSAFVLMPDAEWYLVNTEGLIEFCKEKLEQGDKTQIYSVRLQGRNIDFPVSRLIKADTKARFSGSVHETMPSSGVKTPNSIYFNYHVSYDGAKKTEGRWKRDKELLLRDYEKDPSPRTTFYLAQTYECLGELHTAFEYYLERSKMVGWDEEDYETFYRLGRVVSKLAEKDENFSWDMARGYYEHAYKMRPHRAEPLFKIGEHYWPDNAPVSYVFAERACALKYPEKEMLFVEADIYDYWRYELLSKAAWYAQDWKAGEFASRKAIEKASNQPHLYRNLSLYLDKLQGR